MDKDVKKKAKGAAKMYKSLWVQQKLQAQTDRKKKQRGAKALAGSSSRATVDGSEAVKPPPRKIGKKGGASKEEQQDLEVVIEDLKTELEWKEEEFKEMREELEALRLQNKQMHKTNLKEKQDRQVLTANKLKYTMLKELVENNGSIQDQSFFENKRNEKNAAANGVNGSLMN